MSGVHLSLPGTGTSQEQTLPLTDGQQQLWFIDEFHHGLPAHNVPHRLGLHGPLDLAAFRRAIDGLADRQAVLRTRFPAGHDGMPVQVIDRAGPVRLELADFAGLGRHEARRRLGELAIAEAKRPILVGTGWPVRATLVRLSQREHALIVVVHQLAFDEASFGVLVRDLASLYDLAARNETAVTGRAPAGLARLPVTFAGYTLAERDRLAGAGRAGLERYWQEALAGLPASRFPADRPRPLLASHDGAIETTTIGRDILDGLRELAVRSGTTLATTLLACLHALLYRYTGQTDLVIGTAAANRDRPELAPLIGFLESTLPIRADASGDPPFTELLSRVSRAVNAATSHQGLPFARIVETLGVERDTGRFPVFQTWLRCREPVSEVTGGGVTFRPASAELLASRYDLAFDARPGEDGLEIVATYPPALFDQGTVRRLLGHLGVLLRGVVADPGAPLSRLPVLTSAELHQELTGWNDTAREFPRICIHEGFERQAAATPEAIAAQYGHDQVSYADLNRRADAIAARLRAAGVGPETLTGICMRTSLTRLAALLGIWKAGGGYVPLDPDQPAGRLAT